jgi:hypothetical protein
MDRLNIDGKVEKHMDRQTEGCKVRLTVGEKISRQKDKCGIDKQGIKLTIKNKQRTNRQMH